MTKLSLALLFFVSSLVDNNNSNVEGQSSITDPSIATPADLWRIEPQPQLDYDDNYGFYFIYTVSNFIDQGQAGFYIYDQNCRSSGGSIETVGFDMTSSQIVQDVTPGSETNLTQIEMNKSVELFVKIDSASIATNPNVFINYRPGESDIFFCLVFYLNQKMGENDNNDNDASAPLEIAVQETEVNLIVNMTKLGTGFEIKEIDVRPKDRTTTGNQLSYATEAFLCNPDTGMAITPIQQTSPFVQGSVVSICIKPDDASLAEGVRMDSLVDFGFTREGIQQTVIIDGTSASDGLTDYTPTSCFEKEWCSISTMLFASFFTDAPGTVRGNGVASIKFPGSSNRDRDRDRGRRVLQRQSNGNNDDDDPTRQPFNMELNVATIDGDEPVPLLTLLSAATKQGEDKPIFSASSAILVICSALLMVTIGVLI